MPFYPHSYIWSTSQPANQSINQSINQSFIHSFIHSINPSISLSISQSTLISTSTSNQFSISISIIQSNKQSMNSASILSHSTGRLLSPTVPHCTFLLHPFSHFLHFLLLHDALYLRHMCAEYGWETVIVNHPATSSAPLKPNSRNAGHAHHQESYKGNQESGISI